MLNAPGFAFIRLFNDSFFSNEKIEQKKLQFTFTYLIQMSRFQNASKKMKLFFCWNLTPL